MQDEGTRYTLSEPLPSWRPSCRKVAYAREKDAQRALRRATGWAPKKNGERNKRFYWHEACSAYHLTSMG